MTNIVFYKGKLSSYINNKVGFFYLCTKPNLVVEGVWQLMPHDNAHGAEVEALGVVEAEEGELEDTGREHDLYQRQIQVEVGPVNSIRPQFQYRMRCNKVEIILVSKLVKRLSAQY